MKTTPEALQTTVGQRVDLIDTPALVVDLDAMDRNIQRMADFARKHQVRWRPHAKMHKSAELALLLQQAGAQGVCVQKVSEAEALAAGGVLDITITNEVIAMPKLHRVARLAAQLAARGGRLGVAVDHIDGIERLAEAMAQSGSDAGIDVLVEIDVGQGRCGVPPGEAAVPWRRPWCAAPGCALRACRPTMAEPSTCPAAWAAARPSPRWWRRPITRANSLRPRALPCP